MALDIIRASLNFTVMKTSSFVFILKSTDYFVFSFFRQNRQNRWPSRQSLANNAFPTWSDLFELEIVLNSPVPSKEVRRGLMMMWRCTYKVVFYIWFFWDCRLSMERLNAEWRGLVVRLSLLSSSVITWDLAERGEFNKAFLFYDDECDSSSPSKELNSVHASGKDENRRGMKWTKVPRVY